MVSGYVDIHCHILPGVDDGAASLSDALEMARMASADGVRIIVATPHASHEYPALPIPDVFERVRRLQEAIDGLRLPLTILPGADVHICESLAAQLKQRQVLTVADTGRYLLLELPHDIYIPFDQLLEELKSIGTRVILTHPERNRGIQADVSVLWHLVHHGCLMQVTAGSILGEFGRDVKAMTLRLLKHRLVHFVATDAHSPKHRKPLLHEAYRAVCALTDESYADKIFKQFPAAIVEGKPITIPRPRALKTSLFARLFG